MTNLNRTQSIKMWELISKGVLKDTEAEWPIEFLGGMSPMQFIEQVASKMVIANTCSPKSRPAQIVMAAGLGGKMNHTEIEMRRAIEIICDFHDGASVVEGKVELSADAMFKAVNLMRSLLGYRETENPDEKLDEERFRQVREFLKSKRM